MPLPLPSPPSASPPFSYIPYNNDSSAIFELATLSLIAAILLLSLLSICFILHLRFKTRTSPLLLQHFSSLWSLRLLLVFFIVSWSLNELLRLPFFRRFNPFFPDLTLTQKSHLCKFQLLLSLGFFEPGFLLILLFLVNVSTKKNRNSYNNWSSFLIFFAAACFPPLVLQVFAVFFAPTEKFRRCWVLDNETVICTYPLLSTVFFAGFGIAYSIGFLVSCWRVVSVVINKGLRLRIYTLAFTVLVSLTLQIVFLGLSVLWGPADSAAYGGVCLVVFLAVLSCAAVGEGILVISPISDTMSAGGDCCRWTSGDRSSPEAGQKLLVNGGQ